MTPIKSIKLGALALAHSIRTGATAAQAIRHVKKQIKK